MVELINLLAVSQSHAIPPAWTIGVLRSQVSKPSLASCFNVVEELHYSLPESTVD